MKNNSHIENLIKFGLKETEARVYTNLLKKKNFTATEIARVSGVPRTKIYEILHELINRGLCVEVLGGIKRYSPVNPDNALKGMLKKVEQNYKEDIEKKEILISNMSDELTSLYKAEKESTNPLNFIQVVREKNRISQMIQDLERKAKYEILAFSKGPYAMSFDDSFIDTEVEHLNTRGIEYIQRSVYENKDIKNKIIRNIIERFMRGGEEIRIVDTLPLKMWILDEKIVVLTLENKIISNTSLTAMIIQHSDLAKILKETFYMYWEKGITLDEFKMKERIKI